MNVEQNGVDAINIYLINSDATRKRDVHILSAQIEQSMDRDIA
mgnify:CR=1 FL=1